MENKTRIFEITGAIVTGLLKFVLFDIFGQKAILFIELKRIKTFLNIGDFQKKTFGPHLF